MLPLRVAIVIIFCFLSGYGLWKLINIFYYCDYLTIIHLIPLYHDWSTEKYRTIITKLGSNRKTCNHFLKSRCISELSWNFFIFIFTLFYFTILYWFCYTLTWISHGCTRVPNHEPLSHLPPHIISLDHPRAPAPSILYPVSNIGWWFISYILKKKKNCITSLS